MSYVWPSDVLESELLHSLCTLDLRVVMRSVHFSEPKTGRICFTTDKLYYDTNIIPKKFLILTARIRKRHGRLYDNLELLRLCLTFLKEQYEELIKN